MAAPLPLADARVTDVYDALKKRADQGDSHAACRLAIDLIDCGRLDLMPAADAYGASDDMESALEREGNLDGANGIAAMKLGMLRERNRCEGVSANQTRQGFHYLRQAARAGVNDALVTYGDGVGFPGGPFAILRDPAFDVWRREAPAMMERALRQGEPSAVIMLHIAYSDDYSMFGGLIPDDPVRSYSYRLLMSKLRGRPSPTAPPNLSPDQVAHADAAASRMHREYFDAAILSSGTPFSPAYAARYGSYHDAGGDMRPQRCL